MLATPTHDGRVECTYANGVVEAVKLCAKSGIDLFPVWWPGEALVQHARNMLVAMALEAKVDDLIFVDADQEFTGEQVLALLCHKVDCVGAPVRLKTDEHEGYNVRALDGLAGRNGGLWAVDGVGTGFLRLSREALKSLWELSEPYEKNGQKARMVFEVGVVDGRLVGEDVSMCLKLTHEKIPIHIDPSMVPGHIGPKNYKGNFKDWVARLHAAT